MKRHIIICMAALLAALSSCKDKDSTTIVPGGQESPIGLTINLGEIPNPTAADTATIVGTTKVAGSSVSITGGIETVQAVSGSDRRFQVDVALLPNRKNALYAVELFPGGGSSEGFPFSVTQDASAPKLWVDFPVDGQVVPTGTVTVLGRISDQLSGFSGLTVGVNGSPANVNVGIGTNGTFELSGVELAQGAPTSIRVVARDKVGNEVETTLNVTYEEPTGFTLKTVAGNNQSGPVDSVLPAPIVVELRSPNGQVLPNKVVTFRVVKSNGKLLESPGDLAGAKFAQQVMTDAQGRARLYWQLGSDAGCGNNRLEVSSLSVSGVGYVCATANANPPDQINIGMMASQVTQPEAPTAEPLQVWVSDGCNGVAGVTVTFRIVKGSGAILRNEVTGQNSTTTLGVTTGLTGHASLALYAGLTPGIYEVTANFVGNSGAPARFVVQALPATADGSTQFSGMIFDNAEQPLGGAVASLVIGDDVYQGVTDSDGCFAIPGIAAGGQGSLHVFGSTVFSVAGKPLDASTMSFPDLEYAPIVFEGRENTLLGPIRLPVLNAINAKVYDGSEDVILTLDGVEGLEFTVAAGSMTLADGTVPDASNPVTMSVNQVHHGDIPMPMPNGVAPSFAWTLQPAGAHFDPPIGIRYPNMTGLEPGAASYFLSFDHDTEQFEIVASASTTADGASILADPGSGITVSGWGCNCPPYAAVGDCEECLTICTDSGQLTGGAVDVPQLTPEWGSTVTVTASGVMDSGGSKEEICSGGQSTESVIAPADVQYSYRIKTPSGKFIEGTGASAPVKIEDCGKYEVQFTAKVDRECAPSPLSLPGAIVDFPVMVNDPSPTSGIEVDLGATLEFLQKVNSFWETLPAVTPVSCSYDAPSSLPNLSIEAQFIERCCDANTPSGFEKTTLKQYTGSASWSFGQGMCEIRVLGIPYILELEVEAAVSGTASVSVSTNPACGDEEICGSVSVPLSASLKIVGEVLNGLAIRVAGGLQFVGLKGSGEMCFPESGGYNGVIKAEYGSLNFVGEVTLFSFATVAVSEEIAPGGLLAEVPFNG